MTRVRSAVWVRLAAALLLAVFLQASPAGSFPHGAGGGGQSGLFSRNTVTRQAFMYIDAFYVEPKRIVPDKLLEGAFKEIESQNPEVILDISEDRSSVAVRARGFEKSFDISGLEGTGDVARVIDDVVSFVIDRLRGDVDDEKLLYMAINGALESLDPHTHIFSTKHFKDFKVSTSGSFGGIGFTFNVRDGDLTIISPIPDTPASRAGLRSGDQILFIDGTPTTNMSSDTAVGLMRGDPGTGVTLTIGREGWSEPRDDPIVREIIRIVSVESHLLKSADSPPVVYVRVKNFQSETSAELAAAIRKLETPETAGVILDLRDNPGGLLDEATKVADGFLDKGPIVSTRNRSGKGKAATAGADDPAFTRRPLVVLINRGSASAAEIVAAALQDHRAILLGERSFGKGSVQQAFSLSDGGGVLVTMAQYLTPGDVSIQSIGIEPEIVLEPVLVTPERVRLRPLEGHRSEADLQNDFAEWGNAAGRSEASLRFLETEPVEHDEITREDRVRRADESAEEKAARVGAEFEVGLARRILLAAAAKNATGRTELLASTKALLDEMRPEQERLIADALGKRGVAWAADGSTAEGVKLAAVVPEDLVLEAGAKTGITMSIKNEGPRTLHRVWGRTDSENPLLRYLDFPFGTLAPGETRTWTVDLEVPTAVEERWDTVTLKVRAGEDAELAEFTGSIQTRAQAAPEYAYSYEISDENLEDGSKSGDGLLEPGERALIKLRLRNRGGIESPLVEVNLHADERERLYLEQVRHRVEKLAAGGEESIPLSFKVLEPHDDGLVLVNLVFSDRAAGGFFRDSIEIPTATAYTASGSRTPPRVILELTPPLVTEAPEMKIELSATDDGVVKDVIVYRGDKKLLYSRNREKLAPFPASVTVPLNEGSNRIVIVARDEFDIPSQKVIYIHRRAGKALAASAAAEDERTAP